MSFGWSAGDIAQAIVFIVKVVKALDSIDGAAGHYREATAFLETLKHTLEPLQTFAALNFYSTYGDEIKQRVEKIKQPIKRFAALVEGFEPSLGANSKSGRHRHIHRKLRWRFNDSKAVEQLQREIGGHMRILDSLLQRLTLDMVWNLHNNLRGELQAAFTNVVDPRISTIVQEILFPLRTEMERFRQRQEFQSQAITSAIRQQNARPDETQCIRLSMEHHEAVMVALGRQDISVGVAVEDIKEHVSSAIHDLAARPQHPRAPSKSREVVEGPITSDRVINKPETSSLELELEPASPKRINKRESLKELYYLILVYFGQLLRDLLLALSKKIRPLPALTPTLIAKYHITFHDAIGRPPRVIDYDVFSHYKVFYAFLESSFCGRVGESWIRQGLFLLANARNGSVMNSESWPWIISPGYHVNMSMVIDRYLAIKPKGQDACPVAYCLGILQANPVSSWNKCSICDIEVQITEPGKRLRNTLLSSSRPDGSQASPSETVSSDPNPEINEVDDVDMDDIVHFKRVARGPFPEYTFTHSAIRRTTSWKSTGVVNDLREDISSHDIYIGTWQERLDEKCREAQIHPPVYQILSDKRGGRKAYSSTVLVRRWAISARYWYDGRNVCNAKEDAAEMALKSLTFVLPRTASEKAGSLKVNNKNGKA